jgi:hypothetical protein
METSRQGEYLKKVEAPETAPLQYLSYILEQRLKKVKDSLLLMAICYILIWPLLINAIN